MRLSIHHSTRYSFAGPVHYGLQQVRKREIAATVLVSGGPVTVLRNIPAAHGLRLLPASFSTRLPNQYFPAAFSHDAYPGSMV